MAEIDTASLALPVGFTTEIYLPVVTDEQARLLFILWGPDNTAVSLAVKISGKYRGGMEAANLSLHWPEAAVDWWVGPDPCDLLDGGRCWGNVGYSVADQALGVLREGGEPALWNYLLDTYRAWEPKSGEVTHHA